MSGHVGPGRWWRRLRPPTLAGRLALGAIAWIALGAAGLLAAFAVLLSTTLGGQVDAALAARAEAVAATVHVEGGRLQIRTADVDDALDAGTSIYEGTRLIEGIDLSPGLFGELVDRGRRETDREGLGQVRYLAMPILSRDQQVGTIVVSSDIGSETTFHRIAGVSGLALTGLILMLTFFALRATVGRAMCPVRAMSAQASTWSDQDLDRRFDPKDSPRELSLLAETLNDLLDRIGAAFRHERDFSAELSHELRTPLAHLHAEVELLTSGVRDRDRPEAVTGEDLDRLLVSVRRLEGVVEAALVPARVRQVGGPGIGDVHDVLDGIRPPALSAARLVIRGEVRAPLAVESDIARRALGPVLENSFRYARTEVVISVDATDGIVRIEVSDDGGRLEPRQTEKIFEPGFRADTSDAHPGAGLGLALTRRICRSAGGDATADVFDGRTTITLILPGIRR
jgi:two-component system heavy metal sensor histidine kinase CusS